MEIKRATTDDQPHVDELHDLLKQFETRISQLDGELESLRPLASSIASAVTSTIDKMVEGEKTTEPTNGTDKDSGKHEQSQGLNLSMRMNYFQF